MDATGNNKRQKGNSNANWKMKLLRRDRHNSNPNQVSSVIDSVKDNKLNPTKLQKLKEKHEKRPLCFPPYIALLPGLQIHEPAKLLASLVPSYFIKRKQRQEVFANNQENPNSIPGSARINFKLTTMSFTSETAQYKELNSETNKKVKEFHIYLKNQIMRMQQIKLEMSDEKLLKKVVHQMLQFVNLLVKFYKIFYNFKSSTTFDDRSLSQASVESFIDILKI